jgi:hypothetical protein
MRGAALRFWTTRRREDPIPETGNAVEPTGRFMLPRRRAVSSGTPLATTRGVGGSSEHDYNVPPVPMALDSPGRSSARGGATARAGPEDV